MFAFTKPERVYVDHAASTPVDPEVFAEMKPYFTEHFGNSGSVHAEGRKGKEAVEKSRKRIAEVLSAHTDEIIFTSSGTEANNLAILGVSAAFDAHSMHVTTTAIEHPSVLRPIEELKKRGVSLSVLGVDREGRVNPKELRQTFTNDTALVSIMYVNNEIGSIQPIAECMKEVRAHRKRTGKRIPYMHVDASQTPLYLPLSMEKLGVDLLTLDAQKVYGPKGVGLLYKRRHVHLTPQMHGGEQEGGLRAGTENVPGIVGFAKALSLAEERRERDSAYLAKLRDYFLEQIRKEIPFALVNGGTEYRVPSNVNISIPDLESAFMVVWLDEHGVSCGSRSACTSEDDEPSYVIKALGEDAGRAKSSLRFTFGRNNTKGDMDRAVRVMREMVQKLT